MSSPLLTIIFVISFLSHASHISAELPGDSTTWTVDHVVEWAGTIKSTGDTEKFQSKLREHGITGNVLMLVDSTDLENEFQIASSIERKKVLAKIQELKDTPAEANVNLTFWEMRSLNRQMTDYATPLLTVAPRWAITTFDDFPAYCRPEKHMGEGNHWLIGNFEWLTFPEYYVWINRDTIMCGLPGMIPYVILGNLLFKCTLLIGGLLNSGLKGFTEILFLICVSTLVAEIVCGCISWVFSGIIWPFIPWWLCDIFFYCSVYVVPIVNTIKNVLDLGKTKTD